MTKTITTDDVRKLTGKDGTFFSVGFHKRPKKLGKKALARGEVQPSRGEYREFVCRFGVKKDLSTGPRAGQQAYKPEDKNLLVVWIPDEHRKPEDRGPDSKGYRSIPCDSIVYLRAHGKEYRVMGGRFVEVAR